MQARKPAVTRNRLSIEKLNVSAGLHPHPDLRRAQPPGLLRSGDTWGNWLPSGGKPLGGAIR